MTSLILAALGGSILTLAVLAGWIAATEFYKDMQERDWK